MTRRLLVLLAASLLLSWSILAQQHPNQKKGFNASDVFQFGGLDHINTFNGNLVVTIPLGMSYPVGGGLSYGLTLVSNANGWEGEEPCHDDNHDGACDTVGDGALPTLMHPHRRANAGFGWTVSLGRLYQPEHPAMRENTRWTYESPDGADHPFQSGDATTGVLTEDGTYIRMTMDSPTEGLRTLEFPNGEEHIFGPPETSDGHWVLKKITNAFSANFLQIEYVPTTRIDSTTGLPIQGLEWRLSDSHGRNHTVQFEEKEYDGAQRLLVTKIITRRFNNTTTALFSEVLFGYTRLVVNRGVYHTDDTWTPQTAAVQVLDSVTLADGSGYTFSYDTGNTAVAEGGALMSMIVPTGGEIRWEWGAYQKPPQSSLVTEPYLQYSSGVTARSIYDRAPAGQSVRPLLGRWTYTPVIECEPALKACPSCPCAAFTYGTTTTTDPLNNKTVNYFSVAAISCCPTGFPPPSWPWVSTEYGQPMAKHKPDTSNTRWLSSQFIPAGSTTPLRSTYARYESDQGKRWRRASSRLVYEDDKIANVAVHLDSDSTGWDGFGHYRTVTTSSTIPNTPTRVATTNYLAPGGAYWNTGLFDETTTVEDGKTLKIQYCFDATNGFLDRRRTIKDGTGAPGANDLIAVFTGDSYGNVAREEYYGGDGHTVGVGALCTTATNTREYRIDHDYTAGSLKSSRYFDSANLPLGFLTVDQDIDSGTGLPHKSRDAAEVPTSYDYDSLGRLTWIKPTGRAWTNYVYPPAGGPFEIGQHQFANGQTTGATLTSARFGVDGLGRVKTEWVAMPDGRESRRETTYNALGWKTKVSELGEGITLPVTVFDYDALGRVIAATAPDQSQTTFSYTGARLKTRTSTVATPLLAAKIVTTKEQYDGYGRLVKVEEPSGPTTSTNPNGAAVTTEYFYDLADRLSSVKMTGAEGAVQQRLFDYDGRGFLRWESQPESGMTSYSYDAGGNILGRKQAAANTQFDLNYAYDAAARLLRIDGRNPFAGTPGEPELRTMKELEYGSDNSGSDKHKGKLVRAVRYNYTDVPSTSTDRNLKVEDVFRYMDAAGRKTGRKTTITADYWLSLYDYTTELKEVDMAMSYNDLDLPVNVTYPTCIDCGGPEDDLWRLGMTYAYDRGRLQSISGWVNQISYWPNGMRNVLVHSNLIADTQVVGTMSRPTQISFGTYDRCVQPTITTQPASRTLSGGSTTLSVTASGTGPFEYRWSSNGPGDLPTTQSITVSPTVTTWYLVDVSSPCGYQMSDVAVVAVNACPQPEIGAVEARVQPDGSWVLAPDVFNGTVSARATARYEWRKLPSTTVIGTQRTLAVPSVSATTTWSLTIVDDECGSDTANVTIEVPLPITSTALVATWTSPTVTVTWPAVAGATSYTIQRRSGTVWETIGTSSTSTAPSYVDTTVAQSKTYAYRVKLGSQYSNADVATTRSFTAVVPGQTVSAAAANSMLEAVNSVRAAAGWPAVTWSTILAASDPLPQPVTPVLGQHVLSCRARMNEALQALGAPLHPYTDPDPRGQGIRAIHFSQVQDGAK